MLRPTCWAAVEHRLTGGSRRTEQTRVESRPQAALRPAPRSQERHASACLRVSSASRAGLLKPRGAAGARAERHDEHFQVTLMATGFLRSTVPNISPADRMLSDRNSSPSQRLASGAGADRSRGGGGGGAGQLGQTSGQRDGLPAAGRDVRRVENSVTVMYSGA